MVATVNYFINRRGQSYGPYSETEMRAFLFEGRIGLSDLAKTEVLRDWAPLGTIWRRPFAGNPITWPFYQQDWFRSLWMTLLWWLPLPLPLGAFLSAGWTIDAVRRKSRRMAEYLPQPGDLGRFLTDGAIVVAFFWLYIVLPVLLIWWSASFGLWTIGLQTFLWLWHYLQGEATPSLWDMLYRQLLLSWSRPAIEFAYLSLASPVFTAAIIRFSQTGKAGSFFNLPASVALVCRHIFGFAKFLVLQAAIMFVVILVAAIAALSGIGAILLIPLVAAATWTSTYFLGELAQKCSAKLLRLA